MKKNTPDDTHRQVFSHLERFWSKVFKTDGCWEWMGTIVRKGAGAYPLFHICSTSFAPHLLSYRIHIGPIPKTAIITMRCGNKICVNPEHFAIEKEADRFWKRVNKIPGGCWLWTGQINNKGYGCFHPAGQHYEFSHRFSWMLHNGTIPDGQCVLHRCDNPPCVNPSHLFLGTLKDNSWDAKRKGRMAHKLTDAQVVEIQRLYVPGIVRQQDIASLFKVAQTTISYTVRERKIVDAVQLHLFS